MIQLNQDGPLYIFFSKQCRPWWYATFHLSLHCLQKYLYSGFQSTKGKLVASQYPADIKYSETCVKRPLSKRPKIGFQYQLSLNAGQKYFRVLQGEHSAILSTFIKLPFVIKIFVLSISERSGSVVECLTRDRGAAGLSLTGVTALCPWARHINPSLVLVQPRKTPPYITERLLMGHKGSNQTNYLWVAVLHRFYCISYFHVYYSV